MGDKQKVEQLLRELKAEANDDWLSANVDPIVERFVTTKSDETAQVVKQAVDEKYDELLEDKVEEMRPDIINEASETYDKLAADMIREVDTSSVIAPAIAGTVARTINNLRDKRKEYEKRLWTLAYKPWRRYVQAITVMEFRLSYKDLTVHTNSDTYLTFPFLRIKKIAYINNDRASPVNCSLSVSYPNKSEWGNDNGVGRKVDIHIRRNDLQEKDLYLSVICMLDTDFSGYDKAVEVDAHKFHFEAGNRTMFLPKTSNLFNRSHIVNSKICTIVFPPASASSASTTELDNVYYRITCTCS